MKLMKTLLNKLTGVEKKRTNLLQETLRESMNTGTTMNLSSLEDLFADESLNENDVDDLAYTMMAKATNDAINTINKYETLIMPVIDIITRTSTHNELLIVYKEIESMYEEGLLNDSEVQGLTSVLSDKRNTL